jgi:signal transduction histidine kinase
MHTSHSYVPPEDSAAANGAADMQTVLMAWHDATARLEQTHESLRAEVRRLTAELEQKNSELVRQRRLADLGQIAAHVAHEVRNGLVPVSLYLSLLRRRLLDDPGGFDLLRKIEAGFTTLESTVNDLLQFHVDHNPQFRHFGLRALVEDVLGSLMPQLAAQRVSTVIDIPENLVISADREMLRRAILNLALNSLDAMPSGGELVATSYVGPRGVELEIADSGCGLSDETLCRATEPFYTTKGGGTGLGLAIVDRIVQAHGGEVQIANCPEGGAAFTLKFPRVALEAAA